MTPSFKNLADRQNASVSEADRLLVGDETSEGRPAAAIELYTQAAGAGSGLAALRLGVLAAMGVGGPSNWVSALDWLVRAAELSEPSAQRQLMALAERDGAPPSGGAAWTTLRGEIELDRLLTPPPVRSVSLAPAILLIDGLASKAMCNWIITSGRDRLEANQILDFGSGRQVLDPIRTGLGAAFGVCNSDLVMVLVQERLARATHLMVPQQEPPFLLSYEPGQHYLPHYDFLDPGIASFASQLAVMGSTRTMKGARPSSRESVSAIAAVRGTPCCSSMSPLTAVPIR
jgi:prolyl 4-hydroxylase